MTGDSVASSASASRRGSSDGLCPIVPPSSSVPECGLTEGSAA